METGRYGERRRWIFDACEVTWLPISLRSKAMKKNEKKIFIDRKTMILISLFQTRIETQWIYTQAARESAYVSPMRGTYMRCRAVSFFLHRFKYRFSVITMHASNSLYLCRPVTESVGYITQVKNLF